MCDCFEPPQTFFVKLFPFVRVSRIFSGISQIWSMNVIEKGDTHFFLLFYVFYFSFSSKSFKAA